MITIAIDTRTHKQAGRIYATAREARQHWPDERRYTLDTIELFCLATDACTKPAVTVVDVGDLKEEAATHHYPVCQDHVDPTTWSAP